MGSASGIEQILNSCLSFFHIIYSGGVSLFTWFSTPISLTGDELIDVVIQPFVGFTPFELSFGLMLSSVLFMALIRFVRGLTSLS